MPSVRLRSAYTETYKLLSVNKSVRKILEKNESVQLYIFDSEIGTIGLWSCLHGNRGEYHIENETLLKDADTNLCQ